MKNSEHLETKKYVVKLPPRPAKTILLSEYQLEVYCRIMGLDLETMKRECDVATWEE